MISDLCHFLQDMMRKSWKMRQNRILHASYLNFYVNAVNELMKSESANPTIGLLICKDKDQTEVQWAFQGIKTPMGVATYDNIRLQEIKSQLPSEEAIQKRLEQAEEYISKLKEKNK